jgi:WD40 repeat protein
MPKTAFQSAIRCRLSASARVVEGYGWLIVEAASMMSGSAPLLWQAAPTPGEYINSVATTADGRSCVAGTFFHSYSQDRRSGDLSNLGHYGIYCWDATGALQWSNAFDGYEGVYWVAISANGAYAASCGWYSGAPNYSGFIAAFDATDGAIALNYYKTPSRVNQVAFDSEGALLAAGGEQFLLFFRNGTNFADPPVNVPIDAGDSVISLGVSADGQWVAAGTYAGKVILLRIVGGQPVSANRWVPSGQNTVHSVAMASAGQGFAVGMKNGEFAYFDCAAFIAGGQPAWIQTLAGASSVYGVAIAADASFVSAVGNLGAAAGTVAVYDNAPVQGGGTQASLRWQQSLAANPNATSIDAQGLFVAVADGHPDGTPGHFTLFNAVSGVESWTYTTGNMSWPIQLAANAMACVAGSDDGNVYYFAPLRLLG